MMILSIYFVSQCRLVSAVNMLIVNNDSYSELHKDLFPEVRADEYFKYLPLRLISETKRKVYQKLPK